MCHNVSSIVYSNFICNILAILKDEQEILILNPSEVCKYLLYSLYINVCMYVCMYAVFSPGFSCLVVPPTLLNK